MKMFSWVLNYIKNWRKQEVIETIPSTFITRVEGYTYFYFLRAKNNRITIHIEILDPAKYTSSNSFEFVSIRLFSNLIV